MRKFPFSLKTEDDLIVLNAWIGNHKIKIALDTAATHTVIDLNTLLMIAGYKPQVIGNSQVETSNGVITVEEFRLEEFEALGKKVASFKTMSYDFLEKGILSPYQGVLGLDFFEQTILTIDFINQEVWLQLGSK